MNKLFLFFLLSLLSIFSISGVTFANGPLSHVEYSTYIGGTGNDHNGGMYKGGMAKDSAGNIYILGRTDSQDYPTTSGVVQEVFGGSTYDCVISKFDPTLSNLLASTYLGGTGQDYCSDIEVGPNGNIYIGMSTTSNNLPTSGSSYDQTRSGSRDTYLAQLDPDLVSVVSSTYFGGTSNELYGVDLEFAANGSIYFTSATLSTNLPLVGTPFQATRSGSYDIYVANIDSALSTLLASTYLGGTSVELYNNTLTIDNNGDILVRGHSLSTNFPTTIGAHKTTNTGSYDITLSRLDPTLTNLLHSTYLGGSAADYYSYYGGQVVFDANNDLYLIGSTASNDFLPTTSSGYDTTYAGGREAFIVKMTEDLSTIEASTYIGGTSSEMGSSLEIMSDGNLMFLGATPSNLQDGPTVDAFDTTRSGWDNMLGIISPDLTTIEQLTYMGGTNGSDYNYETDESLILDGECVYFTSSSTSTNSTFPVHTGSGEVPYQTNAAGSWDFTVTKMCPASCGDNVVQAFEGEECDDEQNGIQNDGCNDQCLIPVNGVCGKKHKNSIYDIDNQGNLLTADSHALCEIGMVENFAFDPGVNEWSWDCAGIHNGSTTASCGASEEYCGDGIVNGYEECDESSVGCSKQCTKVICGDGKIQGNESCDDSNTNTGDGCDAACEVEAGYVCEQPLNDGSSQALAAFGCYDIFVDNPGIASGVYWIDTLTPGDTSDAFKAYCDMESDGGGWTLVLNYLHKGGTNPDLEFYKDRTPLLGSTTLGVDESGTSTRGHVTNAMASAMKPEEMRFYGITSAHGRSIHFTSSYEKCLDYFTSGSGNCSGINSATNHSLHGDHTAFDVPQNAASVFSNKGDEAMTDFPFYLGGTAHWGIRGLGNRWEVDDYPNNEDTNTHHQIRFRQTLQEYSICEQACGNGMIETSLGEECDDGNGTLLDGCSDTCEIEYCRDDAPLNDTSKNFVVTSLDSGTIEGTSNQANSKVAICYEDTTGTRDIVFTVTDGAGAFTYTPNLTPYAADWMNIGIMLHDENNLDIDHHALVITK